LEFTSDTEFPPLPTNKKQKSTTSITTEEQTNNDTSQKSTKANGDTLTSTTVQEAIADAIQKVEDKFKETLNSLQNKIKESNAMQQEMKMLQEQNAALQLQLTTLMTTLTIQANTPKRSETQVTPKDVSPPRKKLVPHGTMKTPDKPMKGPNPNRPQTPDYTDDDTGKLLEHRHLIRHPRLGPTWRHAAANEFGRLAQGIRDIPGTDTITFIPPHEVPKNKTVTYACFVADIRPQKAEPNRVRMTIGGNLIQYDGDVSSPTGSLTTYKLHCNDVVSTPDARCLNPDIENYYLNTPLPDPEYMKVNLSLIPDEIIDAYHLNQLADANRNVYIRLNKGMYGLPQAGILAYQLLVKRLKPFGYAPCRHTPGYWTHDKSHTWFVLVVDDFSVKYLNKQAADDFLNLLRRWYTIKVDWDAKLYCGIQTDWDYANRKVTLSMPGYITSFLSEIDHSMPTKPQHAPHPHLPITYGKTPQYAEEPDQTPPLGP